MLATPARNGIAIGGGRRNSSDGRLVAIVSTGSEDEESNEGPDRDETSEDGTKRDGRDANDDELDDRRVGHLAPHWLLAQGRGIVLHQMPGHPHEGGDWRRQDPAPLRARARGADATHG